MIESCADETARIAGAELHRLVPAVHRAVAMGALGLFAEHGRPPHRPPHPGVLLELGGLEVAGPVPLPWCAGSSGITWTA